MKNVSVEELNALLPQTQCGQCGFKGCYPYAEAILKTNADINQCPPSGDDGIQKIAYLLGVTAKPLNTKFGIHKPKSIAWIDETRCIGCVKCINACPVDAIVGTSKFLHTVISTECTGCELCVAPCPVDCIEIITPENPQFAPSSLHAKKRYDAKNERQRQLEQEKLNKIKQQKALLKNRHF